MTPNQFWNDDPDDLWAYVSAYEQDLKEQVEYDNVQAYNQGIYFMLALKQSLQFGKGIKKIYPDKPLEPNKKGRVQMTQEEYEEVRKMQLQKMARNFNKQKQNK